MTPTPQPSIAARFIGGPTFTLTYGGMHFLTDPTFDGPGSYDGPVSLTKLRGPAVDATDLGPIDAVLLSHDQHFDNLDHSGRALLAHMPQVLSTSAAASRINAVQGLRTWETAAIGEVQVTSLPALHGPAGAEEVSGQVTGFLLESRSLPRVYISGDNASLDVVQAIAQRTGPIEIAFLFVGAANVGRFGSEPMTLNAERAVEAARILDAKTVVPVHAEGWDHFTEGVPEVARAFANAGMDEVLTVLEPGMMTRLR